METVIAYCSNRLTIVGPAKDLNKFYRDERWLTVAGARHLELLEHSRERHAWQFETDAKPPVYLCVISRQWQSLTFLLDYDCEVQRLKGLVKARNGRLRHCRVSY
jgi:hypothetical protein